MQITLNTLKLQEAITKSIRGASNNKMIPITGLMEINLNNNVFSLVTTDATNILKVIEPSITGENFYAVVQADTFSKLVLKTTSDNITLTIKDGNLEFKGNGVYSIELPLDEEGKPIKFPEFVFDYDSETTTINLALLKFIILTNKAAIAETMERPYLTGYYFGDKVITSNIFKICANDIKIFSQPVLLSSNLVELLSLFNEETVSIQYVEDKIIFKTNNIMISGTQLEDIEDYPIEAITNYIEDEFTSMCKIPKKQMLDILDRLTLFVTVYDKNSICLTFSEEELIINNKKNSGNEVIKYKETNNAQPFTCFVDIELLKSQVMVQPTETIELWYGHSKAIKMNFDKTTQLVALMQDIN